MKARINHGSRGTNIDSLLRSYGMQYPQDYYDMIIKSYDNGNFDQCIEQFNRMKGEQQKSFLVNVNHMGWICGERVLNHIIENL